MTLLSIIQDAGDEVHATRLSSVVSNTSADAQRFLRYANKVGKKLMAKFAWQILCTEHTKAALATEAQTGLLPSDFDRFIPETFWDRSTPEFIPGPISAVEWQGMQASNNVGSRPRKFILRGGVVSVYPVLSASMTLAFEYVSNLWCESSGGTGQTAWAADTDVSRIDEELMTYALILEWLRSEGMPTVDAMRDFKDRFAVISENDLAAPDVLSAGDIFSGGRRFTGTPTAYQGYADNWWY